MESHKEHILNPAKEPVRGSSSEPEFIEVSCRIIPIKFSMAMILCLILFSFLIWSITRNLTQWSLYGILIQISFIPIVIHYSSKLKLRVSKKGIKIISKLHKSTMFNRLERSWDDLHSIRLLRVQSTNVLFDSWLDCNSSRFESGGAKERFRKFLNTGWWYSGFLAFDFKSGGAAPFPLVGFSREDIEKLFVAISKWSDPMVLNPDVIALKRDILTGQDEAQDLSFTKVWEESLNQQFEVTNFVPLESGMHLRNGALEIMMLLACGGMSSVYLAKLNDDRRVVVKEMRIPVENDPESAERLHQIFAKESQFLARLEHPNIVKVIDHFVENARDYLVLEYLPGLTLRQHVQKNGPFSEADALVVAKKVAEILEYLHGLSPPVIHRDITPDNLILKEPSREVFLVDFGAANEFIGNLTGTLIGKQCYLPPEQFRGKAEPRSDIYATGATLHFILTGEDPEPISPSNPKEFNDTVSDELDQLVSYCTQEEPEDRVDSAYTLLSKLEQLQD